MLQVLLFVCCCFSLSFAHNIDINVGPIIKKHASGSYFGFSATGVSKGKGNTTVRWFVCNLKFNVVFYMVLLNASESLVFDILLHVIL